MWFQLLDARTAAPGDHACTLALTGLGSSLDFDLLACLAASTVLWLPCSLTYLPLRQDHYLESTASKRKVDESKSDCTSRLYEQANRLEVRIGCRCFYGSHDKRTTPAGVVRRLRRGRSSSRRSLEVVGGVVVETNHKELGRPDFLPSSRL